MPGSRTERPVPEKGPDVQRRRERPVAGPWRGFAVLSVVGRSLRGSDQRSAIRPVRPVRTASATSPAGRVLALLSVVPSLLITAWLITSFPLVALGLFHPIPAVAAALVAAVVVVPLGMRLLRRRTGPTIVTTNAPWWSVIATLAVSLGFTIFAAATHSEHIVLRRDPGAYAQVGYWLSSHGGVNYQLPLSAFGDSPGKLSFASPAFYQVGDHLVPQFMTGWPTLLAAGNWVGGWTGMLILAPIVGGAAVLAVGGLAARLIGPRWAPLAALLMALAWPVLHVSQAAYSEPLAILLLIGGLCLLTDVLIGTTRRRGPKTPAGPHSDKLHGTRRIDDAALRQHAFAAGLVLAGGELVRLDFGVDFALILPVIGYLWARRRPEVRPFAIGAGIGVLMGVLDCTLVTRPYVKANWSSVKLMLVALALVAVATAVAALVLRASGRRVRAFPLYRAVPWLSVAALLVIAAALVIRPFVEVDHSTTERSVVNETAKMQGWLGLPIDGTRGYVEQALYWVSWYLGWPLIVAGLAGMLLLTWRLMRGRERRWAAVLLVFVGSTIQTLARPGITPDHPWADRRLVVEVIPGLILFALWATARLVRLARAAVARRPVPGWTRAVPAVAGAAAVAVFLTPVVVAAAPVAADRTEVGEVGAVRTVCRALQPNDTVVVVDGLWTPTIRGQCRLPVAQLADPTPDTIAQAARSIRSAGRVPVIAAAGAKELADHGLAPQQVVSLHTRQDQRQLLRRPNGTDPFLLEFWIARP